MNRAQAMRRLLELADELMTAKRRSGPAIAHDLLGVRYALMNDGERAHDMQDAETALRDDDATEAQPGEN